MAEFHRLKEAVEDSYQSLKPFREAYLKAHREYVGPRYGDKSVHDGDMGDRPINMVEIGVSTYLRKLVPQTLQCLILTHSPVLKASASDMQHAINEKIQMMELTEELERVALGALLGFGILKVGIHETSYAEIDDERLAVTGPYASAVDPTDWVHDVKATRFREVPFCGNRWYMELEDARKHPTFSKTLRSRLQPVDGGQGESGPEAMSGRDTPKESYIDQVELWDIWLPRERKVVTLAKELDEPLREIAWKGLPGGPFLMAGFNPVMKNIVPNAPVNHWLCMNDLLNKLYDKCGEQASRQKTVGVAQQNASEDANRIIDAEDGQVVLSQNPNAINEIRFGGVDQNTLGFTINAQGWASYVQGNIDSVAGLGPAADTVGQEKIVDANSGSRVRSMQTAFVKFMKDTIRHIGHWMWNDPLSEYSFMQQIEGTDVSLPVSWPYQYNEFGVEEDVRKGPFEAYKFDIEPFAMQDLTPQERLQMLRSIWHEDVMPLMQAGIQPDVVKYFKMLSRYGDLPELADILSLPVSEVEMQEGASLNVSSGPKRYIHESQSAGQHGGARGMQGLQQQLMMGNNE